MRTPETRTITQAIDRAEQLYRKLRIDELRRLGVFRDHARHYGMVVYPSIKSAKAVDPTDLFRSDTVASARLYVHIPFCSGVCSFCHFQLAGNGLIDRYVDALCAEARLVRCACPQVSFHGVFLGGGTPSLLSLRHWKKLLTTIFTDLHVETSGFNTVELHPEIVRNPQAVGIVALLREFGINRASIGIQSFDQRLLDKLKRRHTVDENYEAIELVRDAGFPYVDVDVMYGLPTQDLAQWARTLDISSRLPIDSVSIFYLILRPGSRISEKDLRHLPTAKESTLMHIMAREHLLGSGFTERLTDHFHREYPQRESAAPVTPMLYSQLAVVPLGISGWGYLNACHYWNQFEIDQYFKSIDEDRISVAEGVFLDKDERLRRDVMFGLKYGQCQLDAIRTIHQSEARDDLRYAFEAASKLGLVEMDERSAQLTYTGRLFLEETCGLFFSDRAARDQLTSFDNHVYKERFNYLLVPEVGEQMRVCCVVAHPKRQSFTRHLANAFVESAAAARHDCTLVDLYAENYDPVLTALSQDRNGAPHATSRHQALIEAADVLAIFYPVWWYGVPAILKGWYDKTFTEGFAFSFDLKQRYIGLLGGKRLVAVNTAGDTRQAFECQWGDAYLKSQIDHVYDTIGIRHRCVRVYTNIHHRTDDERERMVSEVQFLARNIAFPFVYDEAKIV